MSEPPAADGAAGARSGLSFRLWAPRFRRRERVGDPSATVTLFSRWPGLSIRGRMAAAVCLALVPVLLLGAVQAWAGFMRAGDASRMLLVAAAERSGALARARLESAELLLDVVAPETTGPDCALRLSALTDRLGGYDNLVRFDRLARVSCAGGRVAPDPGRRASPWFQRLARGEDLAVARAPPGLERAGRPSVLIAVPIRTPAGAFDGVVAAVLPLEALRPDAADRSMPAGTEVAVVDSAGRVLTVTDARAFPAVLPPPQVGNTVSDEDQAGERRVLAAAPLASDAVFAVLSAPAQDVFGYARLTLVMSVLAPLVAFGAALAAVLLVTERVVVRWVAYLQRIAAIYARGRFGVRAVHAVAAPPELRTLAATLDNLAETIVAHEQRQQQALAHKDDLMREIHHRVKNNLQVISSLLNLQQRALTDDSARAAISDTRQRIAAMSLIYRSLYQGEDMRRVDLRLFLEELVAQIIAGEAPIGGGAIRTELHCDTLIVDPDQLAPLALLAVEAIANVRKHAFDAAGGSIVITLKVEGDEALLEIADDGAGLREGQPGGIGRTLMSAFTRQLRGKLDQFTNPQGGCTVSLRFPVVYPHAAAAAAPQAQAS